MAQIRLLRRLQRIIMASCQPVAGPPGVWEPGIPGAGVSGEAARGGREAAYATGGPVGCGRRRGALATATGAVYRHRQRACAAAGLQPRVIPYYNGLWLLPGPA